MSLFGSPPRPTPQANTPVAAQAPTPSLIGGTRDPSSLINTGSQGLRRKPATQKTTLIGGA